MKHSGDIVHSSCTPEEGPPWKEHRQYWSPWSTSQPHSGTNARGVREYIFCPGMTGGADGSGQHLQLGASKAWKPRKQGWVSFPHGLDVPSTLYSLPIIHIGHGRWGWENGSLEVVWACFGSASHGLIPTPKPTPVKKYKPFLWTRKSIQNIKQLKSQRKKHR